VGRTLHNTLAEVLLCIMVDMGLTVSCLPRGTCCQHCPVFVSTIAMVLSGVEAAVVVATVADALALRVQALANKRSSIARCSSAWVALSCSICCCMIWDLFTIVFHLVKCSCMRRRRSFSWRRCTNSSSMTALISSSESCCRSSWVLMV
jgi:hypothetical protein